MGIEAARNALINELSTTLEDAGLEVDQRYLMLVSDLMCHRGYMQQIGRHGIAGTKDSVLARAAFEITVPTIAGAARTGEISWSSQKLKNANHHILFYLKKEFQIKYKKKQKNRKIVHIVENHNMN